MPVCNLSLISNPAIVTDLYSIFNLHIPVCTLSPIWSSDIVTFFPFSRETLAVEGKQAQMQQLVIACVTGFLLTKRQVLQVKPQAMHSLFLSSPQVVQSTCDSSYSSSNSSGDSSSNSIHFIFHCKAK